MSRSTLVSILIAIFIILAIAMYIVNIYKSSLPIEPTYYFVNAEPIVEVTGPETMYIEAYKH
jgi:hypothetical protein